MIPTSDGSRAKALFARFDALTASTLRAALEAAIAKASVLTTEAAALAALDKQDAILEAVQANIVPIKSTALDAAADIFARDAAQAHGPSDISTAIAAGTVGALAAGASLGNVRGKMYRAGSVLGDVEAVASGDPRKIVRRVGQHVFWRAFGSLGRGIFRGIGGKR